MNSYDNFAIYVMQYPRGRTQSYGSDALGFILVGTEHSLAAMLEFLSAIELQCSGYDLNSPFTPYVCL